MTTRRQAFTAAAIAGLDMVRGTSTASAASAPALRIDAHAHVLPPIYAQALKSAGVKSPTGLPFPSWSERDALNFMGRYGIRAQVVSISDPGVEFLAGDAARSLARALNDWMAGLISRLPDRFAALAVIAGQDAGAAATEAARALDVLRLDGVGLLSNYGGEYLGAPRFEPLLRALDQRNAYVFIHPTSPAYKSRPIGSVPDPLVEFPAETTRAVDSLLRADALRRFPNIRWQWAHAGGAVPALVDQLGRDLDYDPASALAAARYDTGLSFSPWAMAGVRAVAPTDHILFGTDWPFASALFLFGGTPQPELAKSFGADELRAVLSENILRELPRLARAIEASHA